MNEMGCLEPGDKQSSLGAETMEASPRAFSTQPPRGGSDFYSLRFYHLGLMSHTLSAGGHPPSVPVPMGLCANQEFPSGNSDFRHNSGNTGMLKIFICPRRDQPPRSYFPIIMN